MSKGRRLPPKSTIHKEMFWGGDEPLWPPQNMANPHIMVIHYVSKVIGGKAICFYHYRIPFHLWKNKGYQKFFIVPLRNVTFFFKLWIKTASGSVRKRELIDFVLWNQHKSVKSQIWPQPPHDDSNQRLDPGKAQHLFQGEIWWHEALPEPVSSQSAWPEGGDTCCHTWGDREHSQCP